MIEIYCDGSCCGNGKENNCGGWGVCALVEDKESPSGFRIDYTWNEKEENTTNNRMELSALLYALELTQTRYRGEQCIIKSDSAYCVNIFNEWIYSWANNGWVRAGNKEIENLDLIKQLYKYATIDFSNCNFSVERVSGHSGVVGNEIADSLATNNQAKLSKIFEENKLL